MTPHRSNPRSRPDLDRLVGVVLIAAIVCAIGCFGVTEIIADFGGGR